jgi:hypothetical protein
VSYLAQTAATDEHRLRVASGDVGIRHPAQPWEHQMSERDEFRQYAEEAMRWARRSKTERDRAILLDLARTWTHAASFARELWSTNHGPPQERNAALRV